MPVRGRARNRLAPVLVQDHLVSVASPSIEQLRALVEIARTGGIAAAARTIGVSQQALSGRISSLEQAVGIPVLTRSTTGSSLTEAGALITSWADDLLSAADRLDEGIRSLAHDRPTRIRVVASQTVAEALLPGWLLGLRIDEMTAGLAVTAVDLVTDNSTGVIDRVRRGTADLGFIEGPSAPVDLESIRIGTDELVVVVAPTHPWAERDSPTPLAEVAHTPLVVREQGSGTRDALEQLFTERLGMHAAPPAVELGTTAAIRSAIASGLAPGVLSRLLIRDDLVLGRLVAVPTEGDPLIRPLHAIRPRNHALTSGQRLIDRASVGRYEARTTHPDSRAQFHARGTALEEDDQG